MSITLSSSNPKAFVDFRLTGNNSSPNGSSQGSLPAGAVGDDVSKATLKLFVNTGASSSFTLYKVTQPWSEGTLTFNNSPLYDVNSAIGPISINGATQFVAVDITQYVVDWLNGQANDGVAIVWNSGSFSFDSKESTSTSHHPTLDILMKGQKGDTGPQGPGGANGTNRTARARGCARSARGAWPNWCDRFARSSRSCRRNWPTRPRGPVGATGPEGPVGPVGSIGTQGPVGPGRFVPFVSIFD